MSCARRERRGSVVLLSPFWPNRVRRRRVMATERLPMRHIREILRLKWTLRRSHRETARSLGISAGAVASVVTRAKAMGLTWDMVGALCEATLGPGLEAEPDGVMQREH